MCLNDGHFLAIQDDQETARQDIDAAIQEIDLLNSRIVLT